MSTQVHEAAGGAAALSPLPASTVHRVNEAAKTVVYWTIMGLGTSVPLVGGLIGLIRA